MAMFWGILLNVYPLSFHAVILSIETPSLPRTLLAFKSSSQISIAFEKYLSQQAFAKAYHSPSNMP
jgi:hypothetical protein